MLLSNSLLQKIREKLQIPDLQIHIFKNDFANPEEVRKYNRQSAINVINQMLKRKSANIDSKRARVELAGIEDLARVPEVSFAGLSLSHCESHFGFVVSLYCLKLGFDLENSERISEKVVARIASDKEVDSTPSIAHLWTAKEAAFKSFFGQQSVPNTISQIEVTEWQPITSELFGYQYKSHHISHLAAQHHGVGVQKSCLNLSIAKF